MLNDYIIDKLTTALKVPTEEPEKRLRASASGKKARYLALELAGAPKSEIEARLGITFAIGHFAHDYLREQLSKSDAFEVMDEELEVTLPGWEEQNVTGHIDLRLLDKESEKIYLVDIKTVDHIGYLFNDPANKKRSKYWAARYYTFNASKWKDDPFKREYLYQMASYEDAVRGLGLEFDEVIFILVCKSTGHFAIGNFDISDEDFDRLLAERDDNFNLAVEHQDNPYNLPLCWEPEDNKPPLNCQYCAYSAQCYDIQIAGVVKGKPQFKINEVYNEFPNQ